MQLNKNLLFRKLSFERVKQIIHQKILVNNTTSFFLIYDTVDYLLAFDHLFYLKLLCKYKMD